MCTAPTAPTPHRCSSGAGERIIEVLWVPSPSSVLSGVDRHRLPSDVTRALVDEKVNIPSSRRLNRVAISRFSR